MFVVFLVKTKEPEFFLAFTMQDRDCIIKAN